MHRLKHSVFFWKQMTEVHDWTTMRRKRLRAAVKAEAMADALVRGVEKGRYRNPEDLLADLRKFAKAQERESELFKETLLGIIPDVHAARARLGALSPLANRMAQSDQPQVRRLGQQLQDAIRNQRNHLFKSLNDGWLTLNEQRIAA